MNGREEGVADQLRLGEQLCFSLYSASLAMNRLYRTLLRDMGITYPQYLVMLVLWEGDGVRVSDIGDRLFLDSATLTPLLKRLESAGLVRRERAVEDERSVIVTLTDQGRALRERAAAIPPRVACATLAPGESREIDSLRVSLNQLRDRLLESG